MSAWADDDKKNWGIWDLLAKKRYRNCCMKNPNAFD